MKGKSALKNLSLKGEHCDAGCGIVQVRHGTRPGTRKEQDRQQRKALGGQ